MIAPISLVGFALAFVVLSWTTSLLSYAAWRLARGGARQAGWPMQRQLAALTILLPPTFALAAVLVLIARSLAAVWFVEGDHCLQHLHHAHLCLRHGGAWAHKTWAIVGLAALGLAGLWAASKRAAAISRVMRMLRVLEPSAHQSHHDGIPTLRIPSDIPLCMAVGLWRPRIVLSSKTADLLSEQELCAVLAHEAAHVRNRDLWQRLLLDVCALFGVPGLMRHALDDWHGATERACDAHAAACVGDGTVVASALLKLVRAGMQSPAWSASLVSEEGVDERVHALLSVRANEGLRSSRPQRWGVLFLGLGLPALWLVADGLHHVLETLLGLV